MTARAWGAPVALAALAAVAWADGGGQDVETWSELEALVGATGAEYDAARDRLLADGAAIDSRLVAAAGAADWRRATQVRVLIGWRRDGARLYRQVLDQLAQVDVKAESETATGLAGVWDDFAYRAETKWGRDVLPLCWEIVLKHGEWPMWQQVAALRMIGAVPDAGSVPVLLHVIETTEDDGMRRVASQMLGRMPPAAARGPVEKARKRSAGIAEALGRASEALQGR